MKSPDIEIDDWLFLSVAALIAVVVAIVGISIWKSHEHQKYLEQHGCQLLTEAPTGRRVYCGKACTRDEKVYVYECADGTRTEVR